MPRPRLPNLHKEITRHGRTVWYVRIGRGPRVRIRAEYGTPEFAAAYKAAVAGETPAALTPTKTGSLQWLIDRYRESSAWRSLKAATRKQRENIFKSALENAAASPYAAITKKTIIAGRERRSATPAQANNFVKAMRGLFAWAITADHMTTNPTDGITAIRIESDGFAKWPEADIARFEARWPIGTRERLALDLLLYTGLRRGDVARLGPQHLSNGVLTIKTEKTGEIVTIPMLAKLEETIAKSPIGDRTYIATLQGDPMTKESFGNWFRRACSAAKVSGSAHGLRKAGATRAADNGATEAQLEAIFGWRGGKMASHYTRAANRKRLAREAIDKLMPEESYSRTTSKGAGENPENRGKTKA